MINFKLVSLILDVNVSKIEFDNADIYYEWSDLDSEIYSDRINIYEFAHRCKKWADNQGYEIESSYQGGLGHASLIFEDMTLYTPSAATEADAIFLSTEFLYNNKERFEK